MASAAVGCSLLFLSLSLLSVAPIANSDPTYVGNVCDNTTTFATSSKYQTNLNTVLRALYSKSTAPGSSLFFATSAGTSTPDAVYGLFLCRGDQNAPSCHDCVNMATTSDLPTIYCPNRKIAVIYYDQCMVRYSNESIVGKLQQNSRVTLRNVHDIKGNSTQFNLLLLKIMNELTAEAAASDKSGKKYAVKQANFTNSENLYTLAQCTPDLSSSDCRKCLTAETTRLLTKKKGAQVLQPSCIARYETHPFYNGAIDLTPLSSPLTSSTGNSTKQMEPSGKKSEVSGKAIIAIVAPVVVVALAVLVIGTWFIIKTSKKHDIVAFESCEDFTTGESLQYDLATLQSATNNFSDENKLGEGGFGGVYKGTLPNGQEVAVKRLSQSSGQGTQEFKNEVLAVAKLQHRNLVWLLGFCLVAEEKLLVYEYVPNRSLDHFLFDSEKRAQLDWRTRCKIIGGVARGMLYLHQDSQLRIIHRDLKASNILLDAYMNPKISDFGMARIFSVDQTQGNTSKVVGTYGYMSPEYAMHGQFSVKSDVYSFGVLVFEIISGEKNSTFYKSGCAEDLLSYVWKQWTDGIPLEFVDPTIRDSCSSNEVMRYIHLGLLCAQELVDDRPTMVTIVLMLDSNTITLPVPHKPAFVVKTRTESSVTKNVGSNELMSEL